ncbi:MAG: Hpt domain-containing protein [Solirubrobacterales bacterium]|nr:Hpt domain-containing protein [Solirubrobacterales bacterium]MBV9474182.1 Hpt domain-containing protein [Solirubrobacterales bacterium]MBV9837914.1 Hpt domain-containing protein [Solirubrobacterales bacterium]
MDPSPDLRRLRELQRTLALDLPELVDRLVGDTAAAVLGIKAAIAEGDLEGVARAAHAARNDALMLGAPPLLAALERLEQAARSGQADAASAAFEQLESIWPPTRQALERAARRDARPPQGHPR